MNAPAQLYCLKSSDKEVADLIASAKRAYPHSDLEPLADLIDALCGWHGTCDHEERFFYAEEAVGFATRIRDAADGDLTDSKSRFGD